MFFVSNSKPSARSKRPAARFFCSYEIMLERVNFIYLPISSFFIINNTKHNPIENPVIDGTKILIE
jgi:hypothetical protein